MLNELAYSTSISVGLQHSVAVATCGSAVVNPELLETVHRHGFDLKLCPIHTCVGVLVSTVLYYYGLTTNRRCCAFAPNAAVMANNPGYLALATKYSKL